MKILLLTLSLSLFSFSAFSAQKVTLRAQQKSIINQLNTSVLRGQSLAAGLSTDANTDYQMVRKMDLKTGGQNIRLQQTFKGIPVQGFVTILKVTNNQAQRVHGHRLDGIAEDVKNIQPHFDKTKAIDKAIQAHLKKETIKKDWIFKNIKAEKVIHMDQNDKAHLAYVVSFNADTKKAGNPRRPYIAMDAHTGKLLAFLNNLHFAMTEATGPGGNEKFGKYQHGVDLPPLQVSTDDNVTCRMETPDVTTVDLNHTESRSNNTPFSFPCGENTKKAINGAYSPLNDAHSFGLTVFNMYQEWYNKSPLNGRLTLRVHYGNDFENAFWDGSAMTFGDGKDTFHPLAVLDVTAHEVSHGFTQFNSNLTYSGESGGMNEAFSDMAGEAAEFFTRGKNDFLVGADVKKGEGSLRYMEDPTKDGNSIDHVNNFKSSPVCDFFPIPGQCTDVHHSSGIYNKVFFMMSTSPGWTTRMAFDVFVKANAENWTASTNFVEGAQGTVDAATDLGYDTQIIKDAFAVVGINI